MHVFENRNVDELRRITDWPDNGERRQNVITIHVLTLRFNTIKFLVMHDLQWLNKTLTIKKQNCDVFVS